MSKLSETLSDALYRKQVKINAARDRVTRMVALLEPTLRRIAKMEHPIAVSVINELDQARDELAKLDATS